MDDERPEEGENLPGDADVPADETGDLPPPSTWAGKARKAEAEGEGPHQSRGMTEEFEGLADELSADFDDLEADEQEEPPDEFEFEEEDPNAGSDPEAEAEEDLEPGSDPETEAESPDEPVEGSDPSVAAESDSVEEPDPVVAAEQSSVTVEADTLALSEVEAAREAAHAGLAARAKKSSFSHEVTTGAHKVPAKAEVVTTSAEESDDDSEGVGKPPKRRIGLRFVAGAFVIVSSMAAATAVSFLLFLSDIAEGLNDGELSAARAQLADVEGGAPQTILVLGSDKRDSTPGDPGRSDTAILLRVDPDKNFLSLMSLPRDLQVPIPGHGTDKLNAAYNYGEQSGGDGGGETLAIKTITEYLDIPINHVVNVDFDGFFEAVNAIDCVYVDVDRYYFNSNEGLFGDQLFAEIDIPAGYRKLCGFEALQYVRYRHTDNDLVRSARQQDFIREARQRIPPAKLLPVFGEGRELIDIFTKNTSSDINNVPTIISMMKSFVSVRNSPVRQVTLGELAEDGNVEASREQVESAVNQFLGEDLDSEPAVESPEPDPDPGPPKGDGKKDGKGSEPNSSDEPKLIEFAGPAQEKANAFAQYLRRRDVDLPIYFPTQIVNSTAAGVSEESRAHAIEPPEETKNPYWGYKYVLPYQEGFGLSYYGVAGVNWKDPPILKNPSEYRTIDGREYLLFYERDRLRLIGWQTSKGSYWVNNTLTHTLPEDTMIDIATSTRELDN